ncbi:MAG: hypothetical protein IJH79_06705, partial [Lentisphaeria bacterium]|nr:hypothetical protein [Lentisphaeria bacterium]
GHIIDRNLLTQSVVVQMDDTGRTVSCSKDDVNVVYPEKYRVRNNSNRRDGKDAPPDELAKLED